MTEDLEGGCACGAVRYRLTDTPLFVHCCHCTRCQRETGAAFAVNAMIETGKVELKLGAPKRYEVPTASGAGQAILRCEACGTALWSHYGAARDAVAFVKVGTLDDANAAPPDIHIFTSTRLPWVNIPDGVPVMKAFYRRSEYWPKDAIARYDAAREER